MGHVEYWRRNAINPAWGDFYSCKRLWQVLLCNASMQLWQVDFTMARFGIIAILSSKWKNISCNRSNWKRLGEEILSVWHVLDPCAGLKILRTWFNSARLHLTQRGSPPSRNESRQHMEIPFKLCRSKSCLMLNLTIEKGFFHALQQEKKPSCHTKFNIDSSLFWTLASTSTASLLFSLSPSNIMARLMSLQSSIVSGISVME